MPEKVLTISESVTVGELAEKLNLPVTTLVGELFKNGIAATINQRKRRRIIDMDPRNLFW